MNYEEHIHTIENGDSGHELAYCEWGEKEGFPILCVHGLTGNSTDFDYIAPALARLGYRVIAIDLPGRGNSTYFDDPLRYNYDQYLNDIYTLLHDLEIQHIDWLGISLGGLLAIRAASERPALIRRLIINDVGPEVPKHALDFIYNVIKVPYFFETVGELEARMRATRGLTWGPLSDDQWTHMAKCNARRTDDGRITYSYDPEIARIFETEPTGSSDLWPCWNTITQPTLILHGGKSVLLTQDIIKKMRQSGPKFDLITFDDCGHVPSLMTKEHISAISRWMGQT